MPFRGRLHTAAARPRTPEARMPVTLSADDLQLADAALRPLLSPLDTDTVDDWRAAVLARTRPLLRADTGSFLLDAEWAGPLHSACMGPDVVRASPEYYHQRDYGLAVRRREI